jgi:hypothetical protein
MRRTFTIIAFVFILLQNPFAAWAQCDQAFIDKCASNSEVKYIKHFRIRFTESKADVGQSEGQFSIMLNKGNHYRFLVCNDDTKPGHTIIELSNDFSNFGGNYNGQEDKEYSAFDFLCTKTGPYYLKMKFKDGREGCGVCVVSLVMQ